MWGEGAPAFESTEVLARREVETGGLPKEQVRFRERVKEGLGGTANLLGRSTTATRYCLRCAPCNCTATVLPRPPALPCAHNLCCKHRDATATVVLLLYRLYCRRG